MVCPLSDVLLLNRGCLFLPIKAISHSNITLYAEELLQKLFMGIFPPQLYSHLHVTFIRQPAKVECPPSMQKPSGQCMLVLSHAQLFCDPMDCSPAGSSVHGILQVRTLEW